MSWISVNAPLISVSILKMSVIADFGCTNWTTFWVRLYNMLELLHHLASAKSWRNISEVADNFRCNVSNSSAYTICLLDKNSTAVLPSEQKKNVNVTSSLRDGERCLRGQKRKISWLFFKGKDCWVRFKLNYNVLIRVSFFFLFLNKSVHDVLTSDCE